MKICTMQLYGANLETIISINMIMLFMNTCHLYNGQNYSHQFMTDYFSDVKSVCMHWQLSSECSVSFRRNEEKGNGKNKEKKK